MKPSIVVDSQVLALFCDPDSKQHATVAQTVIEHMASGNQLVVPASTWCELLGAAYRTTPHAVTIVDQMVANLAGEVRHIDQQTARLAARQLAKHENLSLANALVLGTAQAIEASRIFTTEQSLTQIDRRAHVLG